MTKLIDSSMNPGGYSITLEFTASGQKPFTASFHHVWLDQESTIGESEQADPALAEYLAPKVHDIVLQLLGNDEEAIMHQLSGE